MLETHSSHVKHATTIRWRLTCFCRVCYVMWYGQKDVMNDIYVMYEIDHVLVIGITTCMSMSMTTGRSHRSCLYFLYDLRVIEKRHVNYFTLLLTVSHSSRSNSWRDNFMKTRWWRSWWWRSWCHAGDEDDHEAPKMEIEGAIWYWPYHVTIWLHVMFIMFCILFS